MVKATTHVVGEEHMAVLEALTDVLDQHVSRDPVKRQIAIELLVARHALSAGPRNSSFIVVSMFKHIRQMIGTVVELDP